MPVSRKVGRRGKAVNSVRKQKAMQKKSRYDRRVNTKSTLHGPTKQFRNNPYSQSLESEYWFLCNVIE